MSATAAAFAPRDHASQALTVGLAGAEVALEPSGALWWPDEGALVVADLHFEKGSSYAARAGALLPPFDTRATLAALERAVAARRPRVVIALGDSFHDRGAEARMGAADLFALRALVRSVPDWIWIAGNHDPVPPTLAGGHEARSLTLGPLTFRHEPEPGARGEAAGHLHPCARVARSGRAVRRRCFAADGDRIILPAFGAYAGGLNLRDPAIADLFVAPPIAFMLGRDRVFPVSAREQRPD